MTILGTSGDVYVAPEAARASAAEGGLALTKAVTVAAVSAAVTTATTAVITATSLAGADAANLAKLTDLQALVTSTNLAISALNAEIAALKAAGLQASS
jgi:hypothetical protein